MKIPSLFYLSLMALLLSSCSQRVYFTNSIRERMENNNINLKTIQFYNDKEVTLKRELETGQTAVKSGKVKLVDGKYIHFIILKAITPGVCTDSDSSGIKISFETGDGKELEFAPLHQWSDNAPYQIQALDWKSDFGKVKYDNEIYYIQPEGRDAAVMIRKSMLKKRDIDKRRMKGRRLK